MNLKKKPILNAITLSAIRMAIENFYDIRIGPIITNIEIESFSLLVYDCIVYTFPQMSEDFSPFYASFEQLTSVNYLEQIINGILGDVFVVYKTGENKAL